VGLRRAFGWSVIESVGSRVFDLVALWLVMNALPDSEIAIFGLATAAIFLFNLFFIAPETALMRFQKEWKKEGCLPLYLGAFVGFNCIKLLVHMFGLIIAVVYVGFNGVFYAIVFSLATQLIQLAEISRIYHRMELQQNFVAKYELILKFAWMMVCGSVFYFKSAAWYFGIFAVWALLSAIFWISVLYRGMRFDIPFNGMAKVLVETVKGFSLWSHMAGVITVFLYNANVLFLQWFGKVEVEDVALMTVVNKTANLFFVIPMFIQGFVPVVLANSNNQGRNMRIVLLGNGAISFIQFAAFLLAGTLFGRLFGVENNMVEEYYRLGIWVCLGIFILNIGRPISTFLMMKAPPWRVFAFVFLPVALLAVLVFGYASFQFQTVGVAVACCVIYCALTLVLFVNFILFRTNKNR